LHKGRASLRLIGAAKATPEFMAKACSGGFQSGTPRKYKIIATASDLTPTRAQTRNKPQ
jgi:hypothetical protein